MKKSIKEISEEYNLDLDKIESTIKNENAKVILLQFPDGLKIYATTIVDYLQDKFPESEFMIWMESCFGACDLPVLPKNMEEEIDLLIHFGHTPWHGKGPIWLPPRENEKS